MSKKIMNIYQLFPRVFGNKNKEIVFGGTKEQNGCGTFADIDDAALNALKDLGITHIWLTGVIRHASPNYNKIVKGTAGSPYSITDYYDVDPDLATNPDDRMNEFQQVVKRIHNHGLKVIIDFVPNHLAREYKSRCKPKNVEDFGNHDNKNVVFSSKNNFYYCPKQTFIVPQNEIGNKQEVSDYQEYPAKVTGNDVFKPNPSVNDWYDTVKLNYGVDYQDGKTYFDPIPDTWEKMLEIMVFWLSKDVDGFRCDMAEMVPAEFWEWIITQLRKYFTFNMIAEIYKPELYKKYLDAGFDYLYDKVGLYNCLENILRYGHHAEEISNTWKMLNGLGDKMLRFMENHDEMRLVSKAFVGDAMKALPAVAVSALMNKGPFMIYNGQESGEGTETRTSIFDYVNMPMHQRWMNEGTFDGGGFDDEQKMVFNFYHKLLNFRKESKAISQGAFYDLMWNNPWYSNFDPQYVYAFLRYYDDERLLIVVNFNSLERRDVQVKISEDALDLMKMKNKDNIIKVEDYFTGETTKITMQDVVVEGIRVSLKPNEVKILYCRENIE